MNSTIMRVRYISNLLCVFAISLPSFRAAGQTRMFFSVGTNVNTELTASPNLSLGISNNSISTGSYTTEYNWGKYLRFDFTIEKRFFGPYYWLTGLKINQTGYDYKESVYTSTLRNVYLSMPLLARINLNNANSVYLDIGLLQNYLAYSHLKESFQQSVASQNIGTHLSRFSTCLYFELGVAFGRLGMHMFIQSKAFGSSKDFADSWGLDRNRSLFLLYYHNYSFKSNGMLLTYRLR
ncbi:MAG: outer membrane beta-barrel protein [Bacteroidia bacterium]|nr:outer membrane beta-barrel protein [Bacteroidia bacterium]